MSQKRDLVAHDVFMRGTAFLLGGFIEEVREGERESIEEFVRLDNVGVLKPLEINELWH